MRKESLRNQQIKLPGRREVGKIVEGVTKFLISICTSAHLHICTLFRRLCVKYRHDQITKAREAMSCGLENDACIEEEAGFSYIHRIPVVPYDDTFVIRGGTMVSIYLRPAGDARPDEATK